LEACGQAKDKNKVLAIVKAIVQFIQVHGVFFGNLTSQQKDDEMARLLQQILNIKTTLQSDQVSSLLYFITDLVTSADLIKHDLEFLETTLTQF
jgi:hypothetical protein